MRCTVNKTKAFFSCATAVFLGSFGLFYLTHAMWVEAVVFLGLFSVFALIFRENASTITIGLQTVTLSFLGKKRRQLSWSDVKELGLINEKFTRQKSSGNGRRYIYMSPYEMTDSQRITMVMHWPPKDILYVEYGEKQLEYIMTLCGRELKTCNIDGEPS